MKTGKVVGGAILIVVAIWVFTIMPTQDLTKYLGGAILGVLGLALLITGLKSEEKCEKIKNRMGGDLNTRISRLFSSLAIVAILLLTGGCVEVGELQTESRSVDLGEADSVDVKLDMSSGEMNIAGGADKLLDAEFTYNVAAWKPEIEYNVIRGKGKLIVRKPPSVSTVGPNARNEWDLRLKEDVPMDLIIDMSSGNCNFNMDSSLLKTLDIGASSGDIDANLFGNQSLLKEVEIDVSSGAVSLDLSGDYPSLSAMAIKSSSGNVDADLSGNYSSLRRVDIDLSSGDAFVDLTGTWNSDAQVEMDASSGQITLRLPRDVGIYVDARTSSGDIKASGFRLEGSDYVNDAYGESEVTINIKATSSSGNIQLLLEEADSLIEE